METITKNLSVNEDKSIKPFPVQVDQRQDIEGRFVRKWCLRRIAISRISLPELAYVEMKGQGWAWMPTFQALSPEQIFDSEKEAIQVARKLRIDEIDKLQKEVNTLDDRYDAIEDEENRAYQPTHWQPIKLPATKVGLRRIREKQ